jgi:hypothetical protein
MRRIRSLLEQWNGVRQPDYNVGHLDVMDDQDTPTTERSERNDNAPLITIEVHPLGGVSDVGNATPNSAQGGADDQSSAAVLALVSEVEKHSEKKTGNGRHKRRGDVTPRLPGAVGTDEGTGESVAVDEDHLDTTGFNASYNLPRKEPAYDQQT